MLCMICDKPIEKHDEVDLTLCLSKHFGFELATVGEIIASASQQKLISSWGQPFADEAGKLMIEWSDGSDPVILLKPEFLKALAEKCLVEAEKPKSDKEKPLKDAIGDSASADLP